MSNRKKIYRVSFVSHNKIYEVYVRSIASSDLFGFIELSEFVFGENTQVVVDPSEERLKLEFADVTVSFVPMHAILRIDEVEREGLAKITNVSNKEGNITQFPGPIYTPRDVS
ncbi:MAG: DUF1820 family protein [Legionellales bacterium]|nr:DUF1820 family protein [Legionellales bacterium]